MQFPENVLQSIFHYEALPEGYEVVEAGDWEGGGKYQYLTSIFSFQGRYYAFTASRSGSHYTDWHYEFDTDCPEVERVEVVTHEWREV